MKKKHNKFLLILSIFLLIAGVIVLLYPTASQWLNGIDVQKKIDDFDQKANFIKSLITDENTNPEGSGSSVNAGKSNTYEIDIEKIKQLYADMQKYNKQIYSDGQNGVVDPFSYQQKSFDLSKYGIKDGIFGYISAPSINMKIPIYLGASQYNMSLGAAQLTHTSMPIGGVNTNSVFAGHTAMINSIMFDNIVNLGNGDDVYIVNFWDKLHYKVTKTEVIYPTESDKIKIQNDKDMVTMLTCYPYAQNTQRYVVYCERVK